MSAVEWNKKADLVADQSLKHLRTYTPLLASLTTSGRSELALIVKVQDYCYDNMNFMKAFQKIILLFYKSRCTNPSMVLWVWVACIVWFELYVCVTLFACVWTIECTLLCFSWSVEWGCDPQVVQRCSLHQREKCLPGTDEEICRMAAKCWRRYLSFTAVYTIYTLIQF